MFLAAFVPATASAATTPWTIGAQTVVTSPPAFNTAQDLVDFPEVDAARMTTCPRATFNGPRRWRFEEPYNDADGSRSFSYPVSGPPGTLPAPEPFCDYNHNGHWDGIYLSGGVDHQAQSVHDDIDARAVSFSDGQKTVVLVSVVAQGLFQNYTEEMRARARQLTGNGIDALLVSANHNESSADTVGIYGGPADPTGAFGLNSGIDEYYLDFLVEQVAQAAAQAHDSARPASLRVREFPLPADTCVRLSNNFPTTNDDGTAAAIDPKVRVLQALDASGAPIFTMLNLAAHNQEIGHGPHGFEFSSDWPGYFADEVERLSGGGVGLFLAGDNGSEEDPSTIPLVGTGTGCDQDGSYEQARATGETFARDVMAQLPQATPVPFGPVDGERSVFCVPIENNLFKAAAGAGLFGERPAYTNCVSSGRAGNEVRTEVNVLDVGPELQFIGNPGEAFPALMVGSPWGIEDAGCPGRPNPPVPTWHARADHRFQVGLANDLIGYELPAWAYSSAPGLFANLPPNLDSCANDPNTDRDPAGHQHKLETEGVGPTASNMVASELTRLLDARPDSEVRTVIRPGRFLAADGSVSRRAAGAVGIWLVDPGSSVLGTGTGTVVALPNVGFFGPRAVDANGSFTDFDGAAQDAPGITTRGMRAGTVQYYVDPYPALGVVSPGAARPPAPGGSGGGGSGGGSGGGGGCRDISAPASSVKGVSVGSGHGARTRLVARGSSTDDACGSAASVASVRVAVARLTANGCRYLRADGTLTGIRRCANPVELKATGTKTWRLSVRLTRAALPPGLYRVRVRAVDAAGNREPRRPGNKKRFRIRTGEPRG